MLALGGRNPLGYYKDEEKSDRTFKEIDGVRYSVPGDYAQVDADGTIHLLGRGSVCINSGGEKMFPEEVEEAFKTHDAVRDAVVVGVPHPTYGEQIVAVVELGRRRDRRPTEAELIGHVKDRLARYKAPRRVRYGRHDRPGAERQGRLQPPPGGVDGGAGGRRASCSPRLARGLRRCTSPRPTPPSARRNGAPRRPLTRSGTSWPPEAPDA